MGLEQTQDAHKIDSFVTTLLDNNKTLEDRIANLEANEGAALPSLSFALIEDQKTAGTSGGALTSGSWATRTLNTIVSDTDGIVSLLANQFTLQAGRYRIRTQGSAQSVDTHKIRLRDITNGVTARVGTTGYSPGSDMSTSFLSVEVILLAATTFEVQHRVTNSNAFALGFGAAWGETESYLQVEITKY